MFKLLEHPFKAGDRITIYGRSATVEQTPPPGASTGWIRYTLPQPGEPDIPRCTFVEDWRAVEPPLPKQVY